MVDWVAVWQAAKKGLSHSPYVACFPSASAVHICYQSAPAEGLSVLNRSHLTMPPFLFFLTSFFPLTPSVLLLSRHMDVIADKREQSLCMLKAWAPQHTSTKLPPTHVSSTVTLSDSNVPEGYN